MPMPPVYFAGPIDYVEHLSAASHPVQNWRHRFFGDLPIQVLCPICLNRANDGWQAVMDTNNRAQEDAAFFVGYFPADAASFGTPIEINDWYTMREPDTMVVIHPSRPGVFVMRMLAGGVQVVSDFESARAWLRRKIHAQ